VLGALAIVIAVLIVINARNDDLNQPSPPTVTDTVIQGPEAPAEPTDWTGERLPSRTLQFLNPHSVTRPPSPPPHSEIST